MQCPFGDFSHLLVRPARRIVLILGTLLGMALGPLPANAVDYAFTTFDVPGYSGTFLSGINDSGQVVGGYDFDTSGFGSVAFVATNGNIIPITVPGFFVNDALGINDRGQIDGSYIVNSLSNTRWQGFIDTNGTFTSINVPGPGATQVFGINDRRQVVGNSPNYPGSFIDTNGNFTPVDMPGSSSNSTTAIGINDNDQVVGFYNTDTSGTAQIGFIDNNGTFTSINVPGATYTVPEYINNRGQIVGYYLNRNGYQEGFIDNNSLITSINFPDALYTAIFGINDRGQIVGGYGFGGVENGFIGTPISEPSSLTIFLAALTVLGPLKLRSRTTINELPSVGKT
jgi:hypothetical protein